MGTWTETTTTWQDTLYTWDGAAAFTTIQTLLQVSATVIKTSIAVFKATPQLSSNETSKPTPSIEVKKHQSSVSIERDLIEISVT